MSIPVGITVPKLLPITGTFAPLFATYFTILSGRVVYQRIQTKRAIGTPSPSTSSSSEKQGQEYDDLTLLSRAHANFTENVPLALLFGAVVELNGGNRRVLTAGYSALFLARVLHVEFGVLGTNALGRGRVVGHATTLVSVMGAAAYAAWLVKAYWGF